MTEPTWTPWITNPGTGKNPVPEFSEKLEYELRFDKSPHRAVKGNGETVSWGDEGHLTVVRYRYAIPADLAWLAENVSEWNEPSSRILFRDENGHPVFCYEHKHLIIPSYTKTQWLRARQDLGYESGEKVGAKDDNPLTPSKYHRQIKGVYVDVYDILHAFGITNPGDQHAIKKMLQPGKRGSKDALQDREEAIVSLERANELEGDVCG